MPENIQPNYKTKEWDVEIKPGQSLIVSFASQSNLPNQFDLSLLKLKN